MICSFHDLQFISLITFLLLKSSASFGQIFLSMPLLLIP